MINFIKLVNFEINRFIKLYIGLIIFTTIVQLAGIVIMSQSYMKNVYQVINKNKVSQSVFFDQYGPMMLMDYVYSWWFMLPIAVCVSALIIYIFLIWYREWYGKNSFIYRLLMLPTSRLNIFFAKATTIMIFVFGLVCLQLILLVIEKNIMEWMVPKGFRMDHSIFLIIENNLALKIIIPHSLLQFIISYSIGFMFIIVLFTAILFERSYRVKGIILGICYCAAAFFIFVAPFMIEFMFFDYPYFYPLELMLIEFAIGLIIVAITIYVSRYLLKNRVSV